jgi:hypothetical protein
MSAELRQLAPGTYKASLLVDGQPTEMKDHLVTIERGHYAKVALTLPSQKTCVFRIER